MKRFFFFSGILALLIAINTPISLLAQNAKGNKKDKTEQTKVKQKNKTPVSVKQAEPSVPPGQVGKEDADNKEKGYEKTSGIGKKEGWDKDNRLKTSDKTNKKELQKAVDKEKKAAIKEHKKVLKTEKKAQKAREKAMKAKEKKIKKLNKDEKRNKKELKEIKEEKEKLLKDTQQDS